MDRSLSRLVFVAASGGTMTKEGCTSTPDARIPGNRRERCRSKGVHARARPFRSKVGYRVEVRVAS